LGNETRPYLDFRCKYGLGWGRWMGGELPKIGDVTHVEIDLSENILRWRESAAVDLLATTMRPMGDVIVIAGRVERISEDGIIDLRLGTDLVLLETSDGFLDAREGGGIELEVSCLDLYPTEL
jgi:hypothetical protein